MSGQLKNMDAFAAYEKAIEGYQFQVERYNTWMNYYAIFVGALFIALYKIWPQGSICCSCITSSNPNLPIENSDSGILLILIAFVGWIASICWYGALVGYRKWNDHWMKVIHTIEKIFSTPKNKQQENKLDDDFPPVYGDMPESDSLQTKIRYEPGFISTQKITGIFIFCIALAWAIIIGYFTYHCVAIGQIHILLGIGVGIGEEIIANGQSGIEGSLEIGGGTGILFIILTFIFTHVLKHSRSKWFCSSIPQD